MNRRGQQAPIRRSQRTRNPAAPARPATTTRRSTTHRAIPLTQTLRLSSMLFFRRRSAGTWQVNGTTDSPRNILQIDLSSYFY